MLKEKAKKNLSILGLFFISIAWGFGYIGVELALQSGWSSFAIMFSKGAIGGAICLLFSIKEKWWKDKKLIIGCLICGVFTFFGYLLQTEGQKLTTVSSCAFFTSTNVVFIPFVAYFFFKKKLNARFISATFIALFGVFILNYDRSSLNFGLGEIYNLLGAVCFAIQIAYIGTLANEDKPFGCAGMQLLVMGIISIICLPFIKGNHFGNGDIKGILGIAYVTVVSSSLAYIVQAFAEKHVNETVTGVILGQESVFGTIFSVLIIHEQLTIFRIIGGLIVILAVLISNIDFKEIVLKFKHKKLNSEQVSASENKS